MECVCLKVHTHVLNCSRGEGVETSRALRTPNPGPPSLPFYPVLIEPYSLDLEKEVTLSTEKCSEVDTGKRAWGAPLWRTLRPSCSHPAGSQTANAGMQPGLDVEWMTGSRKEEREGLLGGTLTPNPPLCSPRLFLEMENQQQDREWPREALRQLPAPFCRHRE